VGVPDAEANSTTRLHEALRSASARTGCLRASRLLLDSRKLMAVVRAGVRVAATVSAIFIH
jgi:hypothetical protein